MNGILIREMKIEDWESVKDIYQQALLEGKSTFNGVVPTYEEWDRGHLKDCRYVVEKNDKIVA